MKRNLLRILLIFLVISINIGCDQSTKFLAKRYLINAGTVQVIDNYFVLHYAENKGAFLSLFSTLPETFRFILLSVFPSIALMLLFYYIIQNKSFSRTYTFALCSILGGGISNVMIDRLFNDQHVVDFMNIGIGGIRTGIFNFADLSIMFGVAIILLMTIKERKTAPDIFS